MLAVMAMMGVVGIASRIHAVAETPSSFGITMSMKIRSKAGFVLLFSRFTASNPSFCSTRQQVFMGPIRGKRTYRQLHVTPQACKEFCPDSRTYLVVLYQEDVRLLG